MPLASIQGTVFNDVDQNGTFEPSVGEGGIAGQTVYLDLNGNGRFDPPTEPSQVTGADGTYTFGGLSPGHYSVAQVPTYGLQQNAPAQSQPSVRFLDLAANDIVTDPVAENIYASTSADAGQLANSIIEIDPNTGTVINSLPLGGVGGKLAISDNGQFLYVAIDGAVQQVNLATLTLGVKFSIEPLQVEDMAVMPGHPHTVAVERYNPATSPRDAGIAIYDDGVQRPQTAGGGNVIAFGSDSILYGYGNEISSFDFNRMAVTADGVSAAAQSGDLIYGYGTDIEYDNGRIYTTSGGILDPNAFVEVGVFQAGGSVEPVSSRGLTFFLSGNTLKAFDQQTFLPAGSFTIPGVSDTLYGLIHWGADGLAVRTTANQIGLVEWNPRIATHEVDVVAGQVVTVQDFGNHSTTQPGTISGRVYHDANGNGSPGAGEPGIPGWNVFLDQNGNGQLDAGERTSQTDALGNYSFTGVLPGNYAVTELPQAGWQQTAPAPQEADVRQIDVIANDIVYSPVTQRIYASIGSNVDVIGNSIAVINPISGSITSTVFVGSEPDKLAVSDDGQFLYVALDGAKSVVRVNLSSLTPDLQFSVNPFLVRDIDVAPGEPHSVAVARFDPRFSPSGAGAAIYDDGVRRLNTAASSSIEFSSSASVLYGIDNEFSPHTFYRMAVQSDGLSATSATDDLISGDIRFDAGRIYASDGNVIDPETSTLLGRMGSGSVDPNSDRGLTYYLSDGLLTAYDQQTFNQVGSYSLPGISPSNGLIDWGTDGLAFRGATGQIYLVNWDSRSPATSRSYAVHIASGQMIAGLDFGDLKLPMAVDDKGTTGEDSALVLADPGVLANDTNGDAGVPKAVVGVNGMPVAVGQSITLASGALLTVQADGSYRYDPNGKFESLGAGQTAIDSFTYTMADSQGATSSATVTITIVGANDPPVAVNDKGSTGEDDGLVVTDPGALANDTDVDTGDKKTVVGVNGLPAAVEQSITLASGALLTMQADGNYRYDPNGKFEALAVGQTATDSFTYTMADSQGATSSATVTITIVGANDPPVVTLGGDAMLNEGSSISASGSFTDPDIGDSWTATVDYGDGSGQQPLALMAEKSFQLSHRYLNNGTFTVAVTVQDAARATGSGSFHAIVKNVPPQNLVWTGPLLAARGRAVQFAGSFADPGILDTHVATVDWGDGTSGAASIRGGNGLWQTSASHTYNTGGFYQVTLKVSDGDGGTAVTSSTIMVVGARVNRGTLEIVGTSGKDNLVLAMGRSTIIVSGTLAGTAEYQSFSVYGMQRIIADLGVGDDSLRVDSRIKLPVLVSAGAGNDTVRAGGGPSVLIGGTGQDQLTGGPAGNLLISGTTIYDNNPTALAAILAEWTSARTRAVRSANLRSGSGSILQGTGIQLVPNDTVMNDANVDTLMGGSPADWFMCELTEDKIKGKAQGSLVN